MGDPSAYGTAAAKYAVANHLDGVDFDLENLDHGCTCVPFQWPSGHGGSS
jgi:hypothetical protein